MTGFLENVEEVIDYIFNLEEEYVSVGWVVGLCLGVFGFVWFGVIVR